MGCPLCDATRHAVFLTQPIFRVLECRACGFRYVDPETVQGSSGRRTERKEEPLVPVDPERPHIRRRVRDILAHASSGCALDIGCGRGEVAILLSRAGFRCEGLDVDGRMIRRLRSAHPEVVWHSGKVEETIASLGSFDVVTMYHVLEHLQRPLAVMELVKEAVKPGGLIVVEVPNIDGLHARLRGQSWDYFKPDHLNYFGPRRLCDIAERIGCEILDMKGFYHFSYPQDVLWKDWVKGALAALGFKDVISIFMRRAT